MPRKGFLLFIAGLAIAFADVVLVKSGVLLIGPCTGAGAILLMAAGCITALIGLAMIAIFLGKNLWNAIRSNSQTRA